MSEPAEPVDAAPEPQAASARGVLLGLAGLFLRLGATAFGGPAAHVALMEHELVRQRAWLSHEEFLDFVGATNLIPGPSSTELALHIGHKRAGVPGLIVAGVAFILPAALMATALAAAYQRYGAVPAVGGILVGVKAVVVAVVVQALFGLGRAAAVGKGWGMSLLALGSFVAVERGAGELVVLLAAGLVALAARALRRPGGPPVAPPGMALLPFGSLAALGAVGAAPAAPGLGALAWVFLKIGSLVFGSGYVLLAFLRSELVEGRGWLSETALLDAIAVGQLTPGPVFTAASFIGYLLAGGAGAAVATIAIFLPAFVLVGLSGPLIPRLRRSPLAGAFLDGVNVASLALMARVTWQLGRAALVDWMTIGLAVASAALLFRRRVHPGWLMAGGAIVGLLRLL